MWDISNYNRNNNLLTFFFFSNGVVSSISSVLHYLDCSQKYSAFSKRNDRCLEIFRVNKKKWSQQYAYTSLDVTGIAQCP